MEGQKYRKEIRKSNKPIRGICRRFYNDITMCHYTRTKRNITSSSTCGALYFPPPKMTDYNGEEPISLKN